MKSTGRMVNSSTCACPPQAQITWGCKDCLLNWSDAQKNGPPPFLLVFSRLDLDLRHKSTPGKESCVSAPLLPQPAGQKPTDLCLGMPALEVQESCLWGDRVLKTSGCFEQ